MSSSVSELIKKCDSVCKETCWNVALPPPSFEHGTKDGSTHDILRQLRDGLNSCVNQEGLGWDTLVGLQRFAELEILREHAEDEDGETPLVKMIDDLQSDMYKHGGVLAACVAKFSGEDCVCMDTELESLFEEVLAFMVTLQGFERFLLLRLDLVELLKRAEQLHETYSDTEWNAVKKEYSHLKRKYNRSSEESIEWRSNAWLLTKLGTWLETILENAMKYAWTELNYWYEAPRPRLRKKRPNEPASEQNGKRVKNE